MPAEPPDDLKALLHEWREVPRADANLAARVRASARQPLGWPQRWWVELRAWSRGLEPFHLSVRIAAACVVVGVILGVGLAEWRFARAEAWHGREASARYLRLIDPTLGRAPSSPARP